MIFPTSRFARIVLALNYPMTVTINLNQYYPVGGGANPSIVLAWPWKGDLIRLHRRFLDSSAHTDSMHLDIAVVAHSTPPAYHRPPKSARSQSYTTFDNHKVSFLPTVPPFHTHGFHQEIAKSHHYGNRIRMIFPTSFNLLSCYYFKKSFALTE
jgi:hypothetical protein